MKGLQTGLVHRPKLGHDSIDRASASCFDIYEYPVAHHLPPRETRPAHETMRETERPHARAGGVLRDSLPVIVRWTAVITSRRHADPATIGLFRQPRAGRPAGAGLRRWTGGPVGNPWATGIRRGGDRGCARGGSDCRRPRGTRTAGHTSPPAGAR